jgi:hypothetical protein
MRKLVLNYARYSGAHLSHDMRLHSIQKERRSLEVIMAVLIHVEVFQVAVPQCAEPVSVAALRVEIPVF